MFLLPEVALHYCTQHENKKNNLVVLSILDFIEIFTVLFFLLTLFHRLAVYETTAVYRSPLP